MQNLFTILLMMISSLSAQTLRNFVLDDINGSAKSFYNIKGENLTMIDFWTSWCKPCLKAMPELDALYQKYKDQGVELISINTDGPRSISKVRPLVKALDLSSIVLTDINNHVMADMEVYRLPTMLIVNKKNKVVYRHEGFSVGDEKEIEHQIMDLLSKF